MSRVCLALLYIVKTKRPNVHLNGPLWPKVCLENLLKTKSCINVELEGLAAPGNLGLGISHLNRCGRPGRCKELDVTQMVNARRVDCMPSHLISSSILPSHLSHLSVSPARMVCPAATAVAAALPLALLSHIFLALYEFVCIRLSQLIACWI